MAGTVEGVSHAEPFYQTSFKLGGTELQVLGYPHYTTAKVHERTITHGRWFTSAEENALDRTVVIGHGVAKAEDLHPGDIIEVDTPSGSEELEVVGIDDDFYYLGMVLYIPLRTLQDILKVGNEITGMHIEVESGREEDVDRTAEVLEDELLSRGIPVEAIKFYELKRSTLEQNGKLLDVIVLTSTVIVLISMIGLMNNLSMNILDRTREIGVLRCIGGRSINIGTTFGSEALTIAFIGWLSGIPLGYGILRLVSYMVMVMLDWEVKTLFPPIYILLSFIVTLVGTVLIIQLPLLKATRMRPGDALRYQ
jgi:putative ABC transport system permease protein